MEIAGGATERHLEVTGNDAEEVDEEEEEGLLPVSVFSGQGLRVFAEPR